jgi:hypothetical protein
MRTDRGKEAFGFSLVALGALFLLVNIGVLPFGWREIWPVFPFLAGVALFKVYAGRRGSGDLFAALTLTQVGAFFFVFSTGLATWPSLDELWPFFLLIPGIAFIAVAGTGRRPVSALVAGLVGVALSVVGFWVAVEDDGPRALGPILRYWPLSLVVAGGLILVRARRGVAPEASRGGAAAGPPHPGGEQRKSVSGSPE